MFRIGLPSKLTKKFSRVKKVNKIYSTALVGIIFEDLRRIFSLEKTA